MGEKLDDERDPSVSHNLGRRESDHQNDHADHSTIENRLDGMVPKCSGGVDFRIGVMDQVEAPENVDSVQQPVLCIGHAVEHNDRDQVSATPAATRPNRAVRRA